VNRFFGRCLDVLAHAANLNDTSRGQNRAPNNRARLRLEELEKIEVPAAAYWLGTDSTAASLGANWSTGAEPTPGYDVYFTSQAAIDPSTGLSRACVGLTSPTGAFNSINVDSGYTGTVSLGQALTVTNFELDSGALAQQDANTGLADDLTVQGTFTWTGGTLNSTPNTPTTANVNIDGGGAITLPGVGSTLTSGSTLNFGNTDQSGNTIATTIISGAGTLLMAGQNPNALNVKADAEVVNDVSTVGTTKIKPAVVNGVNTLTLAAKANWGYIGTGGATGEIDFRVVNDGGKFFVGTTDNVNTKPNAGLSTIAVTISSGANTTAYIQENANATLEINSSCTLDVSSTKGASVSAGAITLSANGNAPAAQQTSTLKGDLAFAGGTIGFYLSPVKIMNNYYFVTFYVTGNVAWSGGTYAPGFYAVTGQKATNRWAIGKTLTLDTTQNNKPTVVPSPQLMPEGDPIPKGTWPDIIDAAGGITGGPPSIQAPYSLMPRNKAGTNTIIQYDLVVK
jgi:hypothetical protein